MAISALVNRHVFTTRVFDSGALTVLASVIHQFPEPGKYIVSIRRDDAVVGSTRFEVVADGPMQLNIVGLPTRFRALASAGESE